MDGREFIGRQTCLRDWLRFGRSKEALGG